LVEIDPTQIIITLLIGVGVPLLLFSMKGFRNTSEGTLTGSIEIKGLKSNVTDVKEEMQKNFDKMEMLLSRRDDEVKASFNEVHRRIEDLSQKVMLNEYRLKSLERTRINTATRDRYNQEENGDNNNG